MKSLSCVCCAVAALLMVVATPAHSRNNRCNFDATGTIGLNFGALDPSIAQAATATATVQVGDCFGFVNMQVTVDQGLRGNRTMQRAGGTELIPYSVAAVSFSPSNRRGPGNGNYKPATFVGTVQGTAYQDAVAGDYSDQLIVTVSP